MLPINPAASMTSLHSIQNTPPSSQPSAPSDGTQKAGGFSALVEDFVQSTNQSQINSDQAIDDLVKGKTDNVQQVVMAVANAEMSFQLFMEIRNKLVDSYNELMRMQF
jgi:flagellar hook-basal body complex protein FliE